MGPPGGPGGHGNLSKGSGKAGGSILTEYRTKSPTNLPIQPLPASGSWISAQSPLCIQHNLCCIHTVNCAYSTICAVSTLYIVYTHCIVCIHCTHCVQCVYTVHTVYTVYKPHRPLWPPQRGLWHRAPFRSASHAAHAQRMQRPWGALAGPMPMGPSYVHVTRCAAGCAKRDLHIY